MRAPPVLLTRPIADSDRFADALRVAGVAEVVIAPLMRIEFAGTVPVGIEGLILTSANAVAAYVEAGGQAGLPAWVVGPRTAALARNAGLEVRAVASRAEALIDLIPDDAPPLWHLSGDVVRGDIVGALRARGQDADRRSLYRQVPCPLSPDARAILRAGPVVAPVFSPRSAVLLSEACADLTCDLRLVALSAAVAEACPLRPRRIAETPDGAAMLKAVLAELQTMEG